jgi:hypothetical protein
MSGYIPLVKRFRGACRCSVCSQDSEIVKFYANDILCKFDASLCSSVDDLGVRVCCVKHKGRLVLCPRFSKSVHGGLVP